MKGPYIHFTGFIGGSTERSVTVSIKRGTSSNDALLLLTKMIEAISEAGIEDERRPHAASWGLQNRPPRENQISISTCIVLSALIK